MTAIDAAAALLAMNLIRMPVRNQEEIERAIEAFTAEPNSALLLTGAISEANVEKQSCVLAMQYHLPTMRGSVKMVAEGLLMSNGPDFLDLRFAALQPMWTGFCARCQNQAICRYNIRPGSRWSSITRPPRPLASKFRRRCSQSPTR